MGNFRVEIVNGSPRKQGNTVRGLTALQEGIRYAVPDAGIGWINAAEMTISPCTNCNACRDNFGRCVVPDDSASAIDKICQADFILFGSPVYWWGITAQLKLLLDKFYSRAELLASKKRKIGLLVVGAAELDDPEYSLIHQQFDCIARYLGWQCCLHESVQACNCDDLAGDETRLQQLAEAGMKIMRTFS